MTPASPPLLNDCATPTRRHYAILALAWAGWLFDFYDLMLFTFLLVPIRQDLGLTDTQLSLLLGTSLGATAIGGVLFGWLADRIGRKPVLSITILTYSVGTLLCGLAPGLPAFLVFRIVTGLGVGGEWATGQTLIGETFPANRRARFAGRRSASGSRRSSGGSSSRTSRAASAPVSRGERASSARRRPRFSSSPFAG